LANEENTQTTHHPKILIALSRENDTDVIQKINALAPLFDLQDNDEMVKQMKLLVPEFISNNSAFEKLDLP
jgi:hypothetical protein